MGAAAEDVELQWATTTTPASVLGGGARLCQANPEVVAQKRAKEASQVQDRAAEGRGKGRPAVCKGSTASRGEATAEIVPWASTSSAA